MSSLLNATGAQQMARGQWFNSNEPLATKAADGADYLTCAITVPYAHRLLRAWLGAADVDETTATVIVLQQADDGDTSAGAGVASILHADSSGKIAIDEFTLDNADKGATAGTRMYFLKLVGTHSNDIIHRPTLTILVEPVSRSTL